MAAISQQSSPLRDEDYAYEKTEIQRAMWSPKAKLLVLMHRVVLVSLILDSDQQAGRWLNSVHADF